jgi:hypothetical protein
VKARNLKTGMWLVLREHGKVYLKTMSFTMGNIIHATVRQEDGKLEPVQFTLEQDVEVLP